MSNSIDPDEMAHHEPSHLDLCCLQKHIITACAVKELNNATPSLLIILILNFEQLKITTHYENMPIQIYKKNSLPKTEKFQIKN